MKAIGFYRYLPVEDPQSLVAVEVPTPEPGQRDLLVRVKAVSVNPVDVKVRSRLKTAADTPQIIGWDVAGVVESAGRFDHLDSEYKRCWRKVGMLGHLSKGIFDAF